MQPERKSARQLYAEAERAAQERLVQGRPLRLSPWAEAGGDEATIYLYDAIGGWFGITAADFVRDLQGITASTIHLRINSPGGGVFEAEAMQTALQQHPARIIAHIDGLAASAAGFVALAADEIEMADGAFFMIHNAWGVAVGDAAEMLDYAAMLEKMDANLVRDYRRKTGHSAERIATWMQAETWLSAADALELGFVDRVFTPKSQKKDEDQPAARVSNASFNQHQNIGCSASRARALRLMDVGI